MLIKVLLCLLISTYLSIQCIESGQVKVTGFVALSTKFGNLVGTVEEVELSSISIETSNVGSILKYTAYRGIPYAEAPIGNQRWQDPIVKRPLPSQLVYNATHLRSPCPQWINVNGKSELIGSEDCLYADVFVPQREARKIFVYFHGGGFIVNSNRDTIPLPLLEENVIVIMFNYRVSVFGYLSTGTGDLPGNYGPLDQIALLKWVQLYGMDFGGDTTDVTVFGSSIGGVSIHYLLLTPLATGLFHRAIMESGSALCERSLVPNPLNIAGQLGSHLNCPPAPTQLVHCLRSKSTVELMTAAKILSMEWILPSVLGPVIDRSSRPSLQQFLSDSPEKLPIVNKIPVIAGITRDEGLTAFVKLSKHYRLEQLNDLVFIEKFILPQYLNLIMRARNNYPSRHAFIDKLSSEVMTMYMDQFKRDSIPTLVGILGDLWINTCHRKTVESLCGSGNANPVYSYLFTHHEPGLSPSEIDRSIEELKQKGINHPILDYGVGHTEEALYIMQNPSDMNRLNRLRNRQMSKMLSSLWSDFANGRKLLIKSGNSVHEWSPVCHYASDKTSLNLPQQEISLDNLRTVTFRLNETSFWWRIHEDTFSR